MKSNDDPNTKGKGAKAILDKIKNFLKEDADADAGQSSGSDTSTDNKEGKDEATDDTSNEESTDETPTGDDDTNDDDAGGDDDSDEENDEGDDKENTLELTQDELNAVIKDRLDRQKRKIMSDKAKTDKQKDDAITALEAELEGYRKADAESVKTEFEALPEEVRTLAPAALDTPEGVKAVKEWLPKVKTLADKLSGSGEPDKGNDGESKDKKAPGNEPDPDKKKSQTPTDDEDPKEILRRAQKLSIYRDF